MTNLSSTSPCQKGTIKTKSAPSSTSSTHNGTLFGHSLSGYYALYNLLCFPDTPFHNFIAASVSFWWADHAIFGMEEELNRRIQVAPARLLLTAGEKEGAEQIAESEKMVRRLQRLRHIGLEARFRVYKGARHRASAIASLVDGARWFYGKIEGPV